MTMQRLAKRCPMTRLAFARQECCQYVKGQCAVIRGIPVSTGDSPRREPALNGSCPLGDPRKRCRFFDTTVAPLAERMGIVLKAEPGEVRHSARATAEGER